MRKAILFAALVGIAAASSSRAADEPTVVESAHWRLMSTGPRDEAQDWSKMLEAAWPQYAEFFGKAPTLAKDERLAARFFEDSTSMQAAIRAAGGTPPDTGEGGYYDPNSKCAYLFRQPSAWYTRALLLHECAHEFHWRAKTLSTGPVFWFGEGIAEHLSRHTWDGEHLRLGVVPLCTLEKYPQKALDELKAPSFDFDKWFGGAADDRPLAMHLVGFLAKSDAKTKKKFGELAAALDRGTKCDVGEFAKTFGAAKKLLPAWRSWVESVQEPWEVLTVDWDDRAADALRAFSPNCFSLCRRRADASYVSAVVRPLGTGAWKAGLLVRYSGPDDYDVAMLRDGSRVRVDRRKDGAWQTLSETDAPAGDAGEWRIEAVRDGDSIRVSVQGAAVATFDAPRGSMGLAADASTVDFTQVVTK